MKSLTFPKNKLLKTFSLFLLGKDQGWIYATSTLIDITLNCVNQSIPKSRHALNGTGTLEVGYGCSIHSNIFSLPVMQSTSKNPTLSLLYVSRSPHGEMEIV